MENIHILQELREKEAPWELRISRENNLNIHHYRDIHFKKHTDMNTESSSCAGPAELLVWWAHMISYDLNRLLFVLRRETIIQVKLCPMFLNNSSFHPAIFTKRVRVIKVAGLNARAGFHSKMIPLWTLTFDCFEGMSRTVVADVQLCHRSSYINKKWPWASCLLWWPLCVNGFEGIHPSLMQRPKGGDPPNLLMWSRLTLFLFLWRATAGLELDDGYDVDWTFPVYVLA